MKKTIFLLFSVIIFFGLLVFVSSSAVFKPGDIGLGKYTSGYSPKINGYSIHGMNSMTSLLDLKKGWAKRGQKEVILWLGNSQLHGINQMKIGDKNCIDYSFCSFTKYNERKEVLGFSLPNANLMEFLVVFLEASNQMLIKDLIILVCFDDIRENGLRTELSDTVCSKMTLKELNDVPDIGASLVNELRKGYKTNELNKKDLTAVNKSKTIPWIPTLIQERSEAFLNKEFDKYCLLWEKRSSMRGYIFNWLFKLRNTVLFIKADSKRKILRGPYQSNFKALTTILSISKDQNIKVLLYVSPIRNDVPIPYDSNEYSLFKKELILLANQYNARFVNLENLVPPKYWGFKESTNIFQSDEVDYMHFQAAGHKLISDTIVELLKELK